MEFYSPCEFYVDCWFSQIVKEHYLFTSVCTMGTGQQGAYGVRPPIERKILAGPEKPLKRVIKLPFQSKILNAESV